jgi:hypothetical protein
MHQASELRVTVVGLMNGTLRYGIPRIPAPRHTEQPGLRLPEALRLRVKDSLAAIVSWCATPRATAMLRTLVAYGNMLVSIIMSWAAAESCDPGK